MRLLITRPEPDASSLATLLEDQGHEAAIAPLMDVRFQDIPAPDLAGAQALIFTSANGVRAYASSSSERDLPAYCVGNATAQCAREQGFSGVHSADGDVHSLARLVKARLVARNGELVHIAGTVSAGDLAGVLAADGFKVRRSVLYEAVPGSSLDTDVVQKIRSGYFDYILFFSPRTARIFMTLAEQQELVPDLSRNSAACLSNAVYETLHSSHWQRIVVASSPTQASLLAAVGI